MTNYFQPFNNQCRWQLKWGSYCCAAFLLMVLVACQPTSEPAPLFRRLPTEQTNIDFVNTILENDTHNILNFTNLYTGAGLGVGDFNRDGWPDLFFGGNIKSSRLYLNQKNFQFKDITEEAGLNTNRWITGVTVGDINADGWPDIYLSVSGKADAGQRKNLLYINQGENSEGTLHFLEQAADYGLADTAQCTHANFFDYDKDGDLDLLVIINPTDYQLYNVNNIRQRKLDGQSPSTDRLYRNNGDGSFTDVSREAGILIEGYSLGLNVSDLNGDHWPDIYITNDFLTNDILYINNQDGTFTNRAAEMLRHTSFASMGIDVADINNDAHPDIYVLDMFPEDPYRQKMIMPGGNYDRFYYALKAGYEPQYSRNTLQLNNGNGTFSEIGQLANIHKTDWSWCPLLADYDNDGYRDLVVTNGFRRDLGNLDYINYSNANPFGSPEAKRKEQLKAIKRQAGAKLLNYAFKNEGGTVFSDQSYNWGLTDSSYSHAAAYADLDKDGDLDLIMSNVSQPVFIYENLCEQRNAHHYLSIQLSGSQRKESVLGTKVWVYGKDQQWYAEHNPYSGYQGTVEDQLHFGLGLIDRIDSLRIRWPEGQEDVYRAVNVDTLLLFKPSLSVKEQARKRPLAQQTLFRAVEDSSLVYHHQEDPQVDFRAQPLLPHQHSRSGPCLAVADVNGDGRQDLFIGGAAGELASLYIQQSNGQFTIQHFPWDQEKEDTDALFFDADGDGDLDLYVVSGGVVMGNDPKIYQDRLYLNVGDGTFEPAIHRLPVMLSSGAVVAANDYDQDGDLDLFVGGRVTPGEYPRIPRSYLLENERGQFKDVSPEALRRVGMVTAALWTDNDQDGDADLMLVGEFMPITLFENEQGKLQRQTPQGLAYSAGWWNSLTEGDFDGDGDPDYLVGNLGLNSNYKASAQEPVSIYANDFDQNGSLDPVLCQYLKGLEYPVASRDELVRQIPPIKVRFNTYHQYALATFEELFKRPEKKGMIHSRAYELRSCYIENQGKGEMELRALPLEMQWAPIQGFLQDDFNGDGYLDALAIGNAYTTEVVVGRYDAFNGALLLGNGEGSFEVVQGMDCGFYVNKDARDLVCLELAGGEKWIVVGNNSDQLQRFTPLVNAHQQIVINE